MEEGDGLLDSLRSVMELGFFPTIDQLEAASSETLFHRTLIFWSVIAASTAVALSIVGLRSWLCEPFEQSHDFDYGSFTQGDVMFVAYHMTLVYGVLELGVFAGSTGRVHLQSGMAFEFYLIAVFEALSCTVVHAFWENVEAIHVIEALLPIGERFDLLRDATAAAAFICAGTVVSYWAAVLVCASTVLSNLIIYSRRDDLRQLRNEFWKRKGPPLVFPGRDVRKTQAGHTYSRLASSDLHGLLETPQDDGGAAEDGCCHWLRLQLRSLYEKSVLELLRIGGSSTSNARQVAMLYEQIPQAIVSTVVLLLMDELSPVILCCALLAWLQIILMTLARPYILCAQARHGIPWTNVSPNDMIRARQNRLWKSDPGRKVLQYILLHKGFGSKERLVAAEELGKEIKLEAGKLPPESLSRPDFHSNMLYEEQATIVESLVQQDEEQLLRRFAEEADVLIDDEDHFNMEKGIVQSKKWGMVAALLNHVGGANVNYCGLTEEAFIQEVLPKLKEELALTYLNLNDNKHLCKTQAGVNALATLMKKCPRLKNLKLKRSIAEDDFKKKLLQEWARHHQLHVQGLELEDTKALASSQSQNSIDVNSSRKFAARAKSWASIPSERQGA